LATNTTGLPDLRTISAKVRSSGIRPVGVDHEEDQVRLADRDLRLLAHAAGAFRAGVLETGGVDDVEARS
jgi:hypothetical protein